MILLTCPFKSVDGRVEWKTKGFSNFFSIVFAVHLPQQSEYIFFENLKKICNKFCKNCLFCQQNKSKNQLFIKRHHIVFRF